MNTFGAIGLLAGRILTQTSAGYAAQELTKKGMKRLAPHATNKAFKVVKRGAPVVAQSVAYQGSGVLYDCAATRFVKATKQVIVKKKEEEKPKRKGIKVKKTKKA